MPFKQNSQIGLYSVIVMILTSCLGVRWIPVAGGIGPSAVIFWFLGAVLFFIPLSIIVTELSANYAKDGGMYLWVKEALGEKYAFYTAWFYWANNLFFYPGLLVFMVANLAYLIGQQQLANNHLFVVSFVLVSLWLAILINIMGVKFIARIASFACILNLGLFAFIIIGGFYYYFKFGVSATDFHPKSFLPNNDLFNNISNLSLLMFGLSGIELIPIMSGSVRDARRTMRCGVIISGFLIMFMYILGSVAINLIITPKELNNTTGLIEAIITVSDKIHLYGVATLLIAALIIVEFGALVIWLIAPTVLLFECVEPGILPPFVQKLNKNNVPANALLIIGLLVSIIVILTEYLPTINSIFTILVLLGTVVYFIPYLFLAIAYIKLKSANKLSVNIINQHFGYVCAILLFVSVSIGIILSFVPSSDIHTLKDIIIYEAEMILGPVIFIVFGYWLYKRKSVAN